MFYCGAEVKKLYTWPLITVTGHLPSQNIPIKNPVFKKNLPTFVFFTMSLLYRNGLVNFKKKLHIYQTFKPSFNGFIVAHKSWNWIAPGLEEVTQCVLIDNTFCHSDHHSGLFYLLKILFNSSALRIYIKVKTRMYNRIKNFWYT